DVGRGRKDRRAWLCMRAHLRDRAVVLCVKIKPNGGAENFKCYVETIRSKGFFNRIESRQILSRESDVRKPSHQAPVAITSLAIAHDERENILMHVGGRETERRVLLDHGVVLIHVLWDLFIEREKGEIRLGQ